MYAEFTAFIRQYSFEMQIYEMGYFTKMKNVLRWTVFGLAIMLRSTFALAQQDLPLEQRQKLSDIEQTIASMDKLKAMVNEMSAAKNQECLKAFGHLKFCGCISEQSPFALTFQQYISVVTHSKEENKYSSLSPKDKNLYDLTVKARDKCVKQL